MTRQVHQSRPQLVKSHNEKIFWEARTENAETNHFLFWLQDNSPTPRLHIRVSIAIYETIELFIWFHNPTKHYRSSDSQRYNYRNRPPTKCFALTCWWNATITSLWRHQCASRGDEDFTKMETVVSIGPAENWMLKPLSPAALHITNATTLQRSKSGPMSAST